MITRQASATSFASAGRSVMSPAQAVPSMSELPLEASNVIIVVIEAPPPAERGIVGSTRYDARALQKGSPRRLARARDAVLTQVFIARTPR
jgi:hypothetical protein